MSSVQNHFEYLPGELVAMVMRWANSPGTMRLIDKRMRAVSDEYFRQVIAEIVQKVPQIRSYYRICNNVNQPIISLYMRMVNKLQHSNLSPRTYYSYESSSNLDFISKEIHKLIEKAQPPKYVCGNLVLNIQV